MITPTLKTERILLRQPTVSDAEAVFNNWATDPDVTKYMRWSAHESIAVTLEWLTAEEADTASDKNYSWVFVHPENDEVFGSGGIIYNEEHGMFEIGYVIMKKYWNKGYTTEAARKMVDFAICDLQQKKLYGRHAKENPASGKVMEKAGFVYWRDGEYASFDNKRVFECKEYIFTAEK